MKISTKLWYGLSEKVAQAGAAGVIGMALLPNALAANEAGNATPAASKDSMFPGDLDHAIKNIFAGEGGEGGAGLTPMWPSVTAPALTGSDIEKVVSGNTLRTDGHFAWYFTADHKIEGGQTEWTTTEQKRCPVKEDPKDTFYIGTDGLCYTYKLYQSQGSWSVQDHQLCLDISWSTGNKKDCRYLTLLLDDLAFFDTQGKIDGKGMKLLKGRSIGE